MPTKYNRIKSGSGIYTCHMCGKETRETGYDESSLDLCRLCMLDCEMVNAEADYGTNSPEHKRALDSYNEHKAQHK